MSADFRTLCHDLGLSAKALADLCSVKTRSAEYWFSTGNPPPDVLQLVQQLDASIQQTVMEALEQVQEMADQEGQEAESIDLVAFRTAEDWWAAHPEYEGLPIMTHSHMLRRVQVALHNVGRKATIVFAGER